ncbi:MAG: diacylglycerol kinase family lipid kinase [Chloroflexi bacterium]|nr:diacylglycerol kinase family lipid kinase [Chloroflexota bacterium]
MKALLIHNPRAGQRDHRREIAESVTRLSSAGWEVEVVVSPSAGELERAVRAAVVAGVEVVIAAGGDGTLNLAIQALAHQHPALGVLPMGTTNVWAREVGIPLNVRRATEMLLTGEVARADLGMANSRYFLFVAGVGFDASVTQNMDPTAKRRLGMLAYVIAAGVEALKLRGVEATIVADGLVSRERVLMVVASNIRLYGGVLNMAPQAFADDGLLDVWAFRGRGVLEGAIHAASVLLGRHARDRGARFYRCSRLSIAAKGSLPVQLDGDYVGTTPVTLQVAPKALRVLVPPGPHPMFRQPAERALGPER